jgi:hypothetical protein
MADFSSAATAAQTRAAHPKSHPDYPEFSHLLAANTIQPDHRMSHPKTAGFLWLLLAK